MTFLNMLEEENAKTRPAVVEQEDEEEVEAVYEEDERIRSSG